MARPAPTDAISARPQPHKPLTDPTAWAVLINPHAFRMSVADRAARLQRLAEDRQIPAYRVDGPESIARVLESLSGRMPSRLVVAAGDGTVQATCDWLARHCTATPPEVLVLAGGRTNFVARDLGTRKPVVAMFRKALQAGRFTIETRRTLHLEHPDFGNTHAFFVAGGLVDHVIRNVHSWRNRNDHWLHKGPLGSQVGMARMGVQRLMGRSSYRAPEMEIHAAGLGRLLGPAGIVLISTLVHEGPGLRPYADRGQGLLRVTALRHGAPGFWRNLYDLYSGRLRPRMDPSRGYLSGRCRNLEIRGLPGIVIDGQPRDLETGNAVLRISPGPELRFLKP